MQEDLLKDLVENYVNPVKQQNSNKPKSPANFLITINPNISYKKLQDDVNLRQKTSSDIKDISLELRDNINNYIYDEYKLNGDDTKANMKSFIEIGSKRGFIHNHSYLSLNNAAKLNIPKINKMINDKFGRNVYINVKYYVNNQQMVEAYTSKGNKEIDL